MLEEVDAPPGMPLDSFPSSAPSASDNSTSSTGVASSIINSLRRRPNKADMDLDEPLDEDGAQCRLLGLWLKVPFV
jgi:hypothetical protein